jgi:hypothetical protein
MIIKIGRRTIVDKLYNLLSEIHKYPTKYLERPSLKYLHAFLSGYVVCINHIDSEIHFDIYPGFQEFIQAKFNINLSINILDIIEFHCFSEEEAYHRFFELLDEFLELSKLEGES